MMARGADVGADYVNKQPASGLSTDYNWQHDHVSYNSNYNY
jgi:hypothetical protein